MLNWWGKVNEDNFNFCVNLLNENVWISLKILLKFCDISLMDITQSCNNVMITIFGRKYATQKARCTMLPSGASTTGVKFCKEKVTNFVLFQWTGAQLVHWPGMVAVLWLLVWERWWRHPWCWELWASLGGRGVRVVCSRSDVISGHSKRRHRGGTINVFCRGIRFGGRGISHRGRRRRNCWHGCRWCCGRSDLIHWSLNKSIFVKEKSDIFIRISQQCVRGSWFPGPTDIASQHLFR